MGDTRTDPGHYYPGGRVKAKSGTAPQELIVQWSDVQGKPQIAPLPDRYREDDMKGKINEIASKFATVVLAALIGWTAVADITVQKKRKDMIYNDEMVVVDVIGSGVGVDTNAVERIANKAVETNAVTVGLSSSVSSLQSSKRDKTDLAVPARIKPEYLPITGGRYDWSSHSLKPTGSLYYLYDANGQHAFVFNSEGSKAAGDPEVMFNGVHSAEYPYGTVFLDLPDTLALESEFGDHRIVRGELFTPASGDPYWELLVSDAKLAELAEGLDAGFWADASKHPTTIAGYGITDAAPRSMISATNEIFSAAVLGVGLSISDDARQMLQLIGGLSPTTGAVSLGTLVAAILAALVWLKSRTAHLESDGTADDAFATDLLEKQVAKDALMIPLESKTDSFAAEDGHAYAVTLTDTVTITMPTATEGKAAIFQARFSAAAQQSVEFSTTALVKFDGTDCGIVKAGKDALLSAMWNGEAWDLVWKNEA